MNFIKNPIIIGVVAAIIIYFILYWYNKSESDKNKKPPKPVNIYIPIISGVIIALLAYLYFKNTKKNIPKNNQVNTGGSNNIPINNIPINNIPNSNIMATPLEKNNILGNAIIDGLQKKFQPGNINQPIPKLSTESFSDPKYHIMRKNNIKLPDTDVFLDIAKF